MVGPGLLDLEGLPTQGVRGLSPGKWKQSEAAFTWCVSPADLLDTPPLFRCPPCLSRWPLAPHVMIRPLSAPCRSFAAPSGRRGVAVVSALLILMLMSGMVLAFLATALNEDSTTQHREQELEVEKAAESAIRLAIHELWGSFEFDHEGIRTSPADFMAYLDGLGVLASPAGAQNPVDLLGTVSLPAVDGQSTIGDTEIESLAVVRHDTVEGTRLVFTATAQEGTLQSTGEMGREGLRRTFSEVWVVERARFEGLEYAMLANNLNCVFCHLDVDDAGRRYNNDPTQLGSYPRIRVGSLDTFQIRHGTNDSRIAGTLYLADQAVFSDATPVDNWGSIDLRSQRFGADGLLEESGSGTLIDEALSPADPISPVPFENLYLEYGADGNELVDGFLPTDFPAVFPDDGGFDPITGTAGTSQPGNRVVDAEEFDGVADTAMGGLSGGSIQIIAPGSSIDTSSEVTGALSSGTTASLGSVTTGSVVMIGTEDNPILLNGDVAIDGDVVLAGVVKGTGVLNVRGNIYLPSDLQYADANLGEFDRTYGFASDGTVNALALAAGGNVVVGDLFHPRWGNGTVDATDNSSFSFVWEEIASFNKLEWIKSQEFLPGENDDNRDPSTFSVPNPNYEGPDFTPRFYTFGSESPVPILAGTGFYDPVTDIWQGPELGRNWDSFSLLVGDPTNPSDPLLFNPDGSSKAALSTLLGTDGWISDAMLEELITQVLSSRDPDETMKIDAAIYTANSIFGLVSPRGAATQAGALRIQGGVVAGDIGLLAPNSLEVHYDPRSTSLLEIVYDSELAIRQVLSSGQLGM